MIFYGGVDTHNPIPFHSKTKIHCATLVTDRKEEGKENKEIGLGHLHDPQTTLWDENLLLPYQRSLSYDTIFLGL
jgi:hypothetical protein